MTSKASNTNSKAGATQPDQQPVKGMLAEEFDKAHEAAYKDAFGSLRSGDDAYLQRVQNLSEDTAWERGLVFKPVTKAIELFNTELRKYSADQISQASKEVEHALDVSAQVLEASYQEKHQALSAHKAAVESDKSLDDEVRQARVNAVEAHIDALDKLYETDKENLARCRKQYEDHAALANLTKGPQHNASRMLAKFLDKSHGGVNTASLPRKEPFQEKDAGLQTNRPEIKTGAYLSQLDYRSGGEFRFEGIASYVMPVNKGSFQLNVQENTVSVRYPFLASLLDKDLIIRAMLAAVIAKGDSEITITNKTADPGLVAEMAGEMGLRLSAGSMSNPKLARAFIRGQSRRGKDLKNPAQVKAVKKSIDAAGDEITKQQTILPAAVRLRVCIEQCKTQLEKDKAIDDFLKNVPDLETQKAILDVAYEPDAGLKPALDDYLFGAASPTVRMLVNEPSNSPSDPMKNSVALEEPKTSLRRWRLEEILSDESMTLGERVDKCQALLAKYDDWPTDSVEAKMQAALNRDTVNPAVDALKQADDKVNIADKKLEAAKQEKAEAEKDKTGGDKLKAAKNKVKTADEKLKAAKEAQTEAKKPVLKIAKELKDMLKDSKQASPPEQEQGANPDSITPGR